MRVEQLWLRDFRSYSELDLELAPGLVTITGANGQGKTNLLEAVAYLATLQSFRSAPAEVLIRSGAESAVVRGMVRNESRELLIEAELRPSGRGRVQVNRQRLGRRRDLLGSISVSVFTPDDLELIKGGPSRRRQYLDDLVVGRHPANDQLRNELDKVVRQRNALLKQCGGRLDDAAAATLDVWDTKLADLGDAWAALRIETVELLTGPLMAAHRHLSGADDPVGLRYEPEWVEAGLGPALARARANDLRRSVTTVGPHRDELHVALAELPARTHASQGEQRTLALSLRLAAHRHLASVHGSTPILLLDDVFSELDPNRSEALLSGLPVGQVLLTTAGVLPEVAQPEQRLRLDGGVLAADSGSD